MNNRLLENDSRSFRSRSQRVQMLRYLLTYLLTRLFFYYYYSLLTCILHICCNGCCNPLSAATKQRRPALCAFVIIIIIITQALVVQKWQQWQNDLVSTISTRLIAINNSDIIGVYSRRSINNSSSLQIQIFFD